MRSHWPLLAVDKILPRAFCLLNIEDKMNFPLMETVAPIRISFVDSADVVSAKKIIDPSVKTVMNDMKNACFLQVFIVSPSIKKGPPRVGMAL